MTRAWAGAISPAVCTATTGNAGGNGSPGQRPSRTEVGGRLDRDGGFARADAQQKDIEVFDFELADDDVTSISELNRDERTGPDPDTFNP